MTRIGDLPRWGIHRIVPDPLSQSAAANVRPATVSPELVPRGRPELAPALPALPPSLGGRHRARRADWLDADLPEGRAVVVGGAYSGLQHLRAGGWRGAVEHPLVRAGLDPRRADHRGHPGQRRGGPPLRPDRGIRPGPGAS